MDDQWEKIFSSPQLYRVEMVKSLMEEENIAGVIINKQDSSYLVFGEIELYVKRDDILQANVIVNRFLASE